MSLLNHPALRSFLDAPPDPPSRIAVFDCDGTVIKGDIGEAMFYRQIERFQFRRSPADVWSDIPGRERLEELYATLAAARDRDRAGMPEFEEFAGILRSWYNDQIDAGDVAKACSDIVRLFAGFTEKEVRSLAAACFAEETGAPFGERDLGGRPRPVGVRYVRETIELLVALRERGFEIWAVSGSNRWSVEPVFRPLGVPPDRVVGIDLLDRDGLLTPEVREPVPIQQGKVEALRRRTSRAPALVASDSKNDLPLFLSASSLCVRINSRNRDTAEFFRSGGITPGERWVLVEHPTIEPHVEEAWRTLP
jgi:phosphoserine phosphatase